MSDHSDAEKTVESEQMEEPKLHSEESSDREGETFEDAADAHDEAAEHPTSPPLATRSLIERQPSSSSTETPAIRNSSDSHERSTSTSAESENNAKEQPKQDASNEQKDAQKSPLLTSHRISVSSLDDVNLEGGDPGPIIHENAHTEAARKSNEPPPPPPKLPPREPSTSSQKSQGLSGALPSVPWGPPPVPEKTAVPPPPPPTRKITGPFAWLSRNTSTPSKEVSSPPVQAVRRNTASSLATLGSNPELTLNRIDDGHDSEASGSSSRRPARNSLRDRFKFLRMREEAGITSLEEETTESPNSQGGALAGLIGRTASVGLGIGSPTSLADEKEGGLARSPGPSPVPPVPAINPNLAPGTVSGISAGPSAMNDPTAPVDWDLWQSVVYEGPAAVARSSADELSRAIASGIPSALRGVIWQVLAQSKNEELEGVYRDLVIRGTDKEKALEKRKGSHPTPSSPWHGDSEGSSPPSAPTGKEKESLASSASSLHSETSTPATTASNGLVSPPSTHDKDPDTVAKEEARRKQRAKEDAAALQKLEKTIKRDLGSRTSFSKYAMSAGLQDGLFGVCKAYALFDDEVGYAQGMNFLAMPLLFNMPEEEAFCLLVRLMNQYHLRDMFVHDMPGLHLHLYQFERLLEDLEPALYCHLHRRGVNPELYATQWFLTLFAYRFPLQLVLRVYDLVLSEGLEGAILKFGIALMQKNADTLLGMNDMVALSSFLKEKIFDVYIDKAPSPSSILESGFFGSSGGADKEVYRADVLVRDACAVKVTPEMLKTYTHEWEEKVRTEKEREAELESLKSNNLQLSQKVRSLEERTEKFDSEHVQVASELVRTKVEKEELKDENEALRNEIEELKALVERQPAEVEQRLKDEMERIMKRNLEVHNENQSLEEQMAEMEKDLVDTKVQFAELNSNHETLKQKWSDLRKVLDD